MGSTNTSESTHAAPLSRCDPRRDTSIGGLVIVGPTPEPLEGIDRLLSCPSLHPVEALADRLASWKTATDEVIEVTRLTSHAIRKGSTAVVYLDSHRGADCAVQPEAREFVCARLGQIMIGLADVPSFVALYGERMARALVIDSLGDAEVETIAMVPGGFPVWELTKKTMFPGVPVAACPGGRSITTVVDMVNWFEAQRV